MSSEVVDQLWNKLRQQILFKEEDFLAAEQYASELAEKILSILANEHSSGNEYYWALRAASFLQEPRALEYARKLYHLPADQFEKLLGKDFAPDDLGHVLADIARTQWEILKQDIENSDLFEWVRVACFDALAYMVIDEAIERSTVISYFKELFRRVIAGNIDDIVLTTHLVSACVDLWPGDCLEEIRECFGRELVDIQYIDMDIVLEQFHKGEPACMEDLYRQCYRHLAPVVSSVQREYQRNRRSRATEQIKSDIKNTLASEVSCNRNDPCPCRSGKKYKSCCSDFLILANREGINIRKTEISDDVICMGNPLPSVADADRKSIEKLADLAVEDPEAALQPCLRLVSKHPDCSLLAELLDDLYRDLDLPRESAALTKENYRKFPSNPETILRYASYLLRRGEPEKVEELLDGALTLPQLVPDRRLFHDSEWEFFCYVRSWCYVLQDEMNKAKIYLRLLTRCDPKSEYRDPLILKIFSRLLWHANKRIETERQAAMEQALQIKIQLNDIQPPIWRRVLVTGSDTLYDLHYSIQSAMGWQDIDGHTFIVRGQRFTCDAMDPDYEQESNVQLVDLIGETFTYLYDFDDKWTLDVTVEKSVPKQEQQQYPYCIEGERNGPPDACGGVSAYKRFLKMDPSSEEAQDFTTFFQEPFDSEEFDIDVINQRLACIIVWL